MAMLLLLALPLVAPAFGQQAQHKLLLCCRMGGAHHCMTITISDSPMAHERCPAIPEASTAAHADSWIAGSEFSAEAVQSVEALRVRQVEAGYRISFHRSRQKRGPPAVRLS
jgi:hypothetical protein